MDKVVRRTISAFDIGKGDVQEMFVFSVHEAVAEGGLLFDLAKIDAPRET